MCCHHDVPIIVRVTCLVSPGSHYRKYQPQLLSLTTPSLESQKQTSAQARFIGGPIIKKMTSHIYTCLASLYNAVMSHVLVMHNKRKASLAII